MLRLTRWTQSPRGTVRRKKRAAEGPSRDEGTTGEHAEKRKTLTIIREIQERARWKGSGRGAHCVRRQRGVPLLACLLLADNMFPPAHVRRMARHEGKLDCYSHGKVRNLTRCQVHSVPQKFNVHLLCLALFRPKGKSAKEE